MQDLKQAQSNSFPQPIQKLLSSAGVLDAVPWTGPPSGSDPAGTFFESPEGAQDYDWDVTTDTLATAESGSADPGSQV